ncbi:plexin domain-containing protein 2-like isoform X2 [Teleopsis dalmanni]|uniref:plexin domain-containing protein 2-like isoform X2 n=1 Tax=Teleopsis dalmanni TaxID=139649 RepID=UPI0018CFB09F|nr:plexin domain-containing protein 2-like isoform X2 [Teleopsis dalmanni]
MTSRGGAIFSIFLILLTFVFCAEKEYFERERYDLVLGLTNTDTLPNIIKLRQKRQSPTDLKNQYESLPQNATDAKQILPPKTLQAGQTNISVTETSIVVPYNSSTRPMLGVNGTGQRKDVVDKQTKQTIISDPELHTNQNTNEETAKKQNQFPKKVLGAISGVQSGSTETVDDKWVNKVDVAENDTLTEITNQNFTVSSKTDHHNYYNSTIFVNKAEADRLWTNFQNIKHNSMLSQSHRRAMTIELSFDFPFYGHPIRNVTVATGGFLYTGDYVHAWLAATQYIAPLMANFDTSLSNSSFVRFDDNGTAFTVVWENVTLQDKQEVGNFTFSATLHKNGDIVFAYFNVPILIESIQDDKHPVKVGLSDAYIIDKVIYFTRRKTIYEYHRVNFAHEDITNSTIIHLTALPTCLDYTDCISCINHKTQFDCSWCPALNRCSTGTERKKQDWLQKNCERTQISDTSLCPALGQKGNNANNSNNNSTDSNTNSNSNQTDSLHPLYPYESGNTTTTPTNTGTLNKAALEHTPEKQKSAGVVLGFLTPVCLILVIALWVLYAYRNPHTKSGQLLIQYRPSQWSWRRGEARYTAATIHM